MLIKGIDPSSDECEIEKNFPREEIEHTEEFLLAHGTPLDNGLRDDFCKIANHEQLFEENQDQLARYQKVVSE